MTFTHPKAITGLVAAGLAAAAFAAPALAQDSQGSEGFTPEGDITFIVPFGAGGGSDTLARTIVSVIQDLDLMDNNLIIENRPGGSGAIGYQYLSEQTGDPTMIGTVSVSFFTTPLLGNSPVNYEDFTPVSAIAMSPYVAVVPTDSDIQSMQDLLERDRVTTGTVGVVSDPALIARMIQNRSDTTVDAIPFDGEGEVISALLGGHIDVMFGNPGEVMPQIEGGELRPIAVSTKERLPDLPDTPTFAEAGLDIEHVQLRGIVLPPEVSDAAVSYWEDIFRQVAESDEWEEQYLDRFGVEPRYLGSEEFAKVVEQTNQRYADLMEQLEIGQ